MLVWIIDIRKQRRRKRAHNAKKFASSTGGNLVAKQAAAVVAATEDHTEVSMLSDAEYGRAEVTGSKFYIFWSELLNHDEKSNRNAKVFHFKMW